MEARPKQPHLRIVSFALHSARGLIRDPSARRWTMFVVLTLAMVLLFAGTTFLQPFLSPREHPGWFIFFWIVCAWLTSLSVSEKLRLIFETDEPALEGGAIASDTASLVRRWLSAFE